MIKDIPGWGHGSFSYNTAFCWWLCCFLGFSGFQRFYLGDRVCCVLYCLTEGWCCIGQLVDLCLLRAKVHDLNQDIRRKVQSRAAYLAGTPGHTNVLPQPEIHTNPQVEVSKIPPYNQRRALLPPPTSTQPVHVPSELPPPPSYPDEDIAPSTYEGKDSLYS